MEKNPVGQKEEIIERLRGLAKSYTPDWRFDGEAAEPGSVIAVLFAGMMAESMEEYGRLLSRDREAFLKTQGMAQREGARATGVMEFELVKPDMPDAVVPEGSVVLASGKDGQVAFETLGPAYVSGEKPGKSRVRALAPGAGGNLPAGGGYKLERSAGFVSGIQNLAPITGGTDRETQEEAMRRCEAALRHQYRAVTPGDYEALVRELCPEVEMARCFPGYDGGGRRCPGAVTVAVLQKGRMEGSHYFYGKTEEILNYLTQCSGAMVRENGLYVVMPEFIRIDVAAELDCAPGVAGSQAVREANEALARFLDPVGGGVEGEGWNFGNLPPYGQVRTCLQRVAGVRMGRRITVELKRKRDGKWEELPLKEAAKIPWTLPVSGQHRITAAVHWEEGG